MNVIKPTKPQVLVTFKFYCTVMKNELISFLRKTRHRIDADVYNAVEDELIAFPLPLAIAWLPQ